MPNPIDEQQGASPIRSILYFDCGRCWNQLAFVFRRHRFERRAFPSGVFLIDHREHGLVLFDTGYSDAIRRGGLRGWLYRRLNPTSIRAGEDIAAQLAARGISPDQIGTVILSHLHPDHIGGVRFFPSARFLLTRGSREVLARPKLRDLLFEHQLPAWFPERLTVLDEKQLEETEADGVRGFDLFGDGSLLLTELPGHTRGHLGAYAPGRVLLAGDACWGEDLMCCTSRMRWTGRAVQHDFEQYRHTIAMLEQLRAAGVRLCFSHDTYHHAEILEPQKVPPS